jgi:hypothetical protein
VKLNIEDQKNPCLLPLPTVYLKGIADINLQKNPEV